MGIKQSQAPKCCCSYGLRQQQHVYKANHRQKARELNGRHKRDAKIGLGLRLQLQLRLNGLKCRGKDAARAAVSRGRGKREGEERGKGPRHSLNINNIFIYFVCGHFGIFECIYFNILKRTFCKTFCLRPAWLLLFLCCCCCCSPCCSYVRVHAEICSSPLARWHGACNCSCTCLQLHTKPNPTKPSRIDPLCFCLLSPPPSPAAAAAPPLLSISWQQ